MIIFWNWILELDFDFGIGIRFRRFDFFFLKDACDCGNLFPGGAVVVV
jgi:hypothetical protein